jgi:hypothetical protein
MQDVLGFLERIFGITRGGLETDPPLFNNGIGSGTVKLSASELQALLRSADAATSTAIGITAGTTQTQAGATALTAKVNVLGTVANANDGVVLRAAATGDIQIVINKGANIAKVYPNTSDTIDGGSANVAITIPVGGAYVFYADGAVNWFSQKAPLSFDFGTGTLDGSNPTPVTHRLNQVVGAFVQHISTTAPGVDPTKLTAAISSNTLNVYAWKPTSTTDTTLIASTNNSATFFWLAWGY